MDEPEFVTALTDQLRSKLHDVILRQETQLNLRLADTPGAELDIEAIVTRGGIEICVIVEAKGIWHSEVETAIDHQLSVRYLNGSRSSTGIYLVAAYSGELWNDSDGRRASSRRRSIDSLTELLGEKARRISQDDKRIHVRILEIAL